MNKNENINREIETIKKRQRESLELKIQQPIGKFTGGVKGFDQVQEIISKLEDKSFEIVELKGKKEKKNEDEK